MLKVRSGMSLANLRGSSRVKNYFFVIRTLMHSLQIKVVLVGSIRAVASLVRILQLANINPD